MREYYYDHDGPWLLYKVWVDKSEEPLIWPPPGPYHVSGYSDLDNQKLIIGYMPYLPDRDEHPDGTKNTKVGEVENLWRAEVIDETALQLNKEIEFNDEFPCPEWWDAKTNRPTEDTFYPDQMYLEIDWTETVRESRRINLEFPVYYNAGYKGLVRYTVDKQYKYPDKQVNKLRKTVVKIDNDFQRSNVVIKSTQVAPRDLSSADYIRLQRHVEFKNDAHAGSCTAEEFNALHKEALDILSSL